MHIFVDESGSFVPSTSGSGVSLVGALVIPDCRRAHIERKYAALRPSLPTERGEVKGRLLTEAQVVSVADILRRNEALLELVAIDMNQQTPAEIEEHKQGEATAVTRDLTDQQHPSIHKAAEDLANRIREQPNQLYVQGAAMIELAHHAIAHAVAYYSQRQPKELAKFHWVVDAKGTDKQTNWENLWHSIVCPMLQSRSIQSPMDFPDFGDYTYFKRFTTTAPYHLPVPNGASRDGATDIWLVLMEHFRNASGIEPGLELADIVVSAARRAMVGNLRRDGWIALPTLMVHRKSHYIHMIAVNDRPQITHPSVASVLDEFRRGGRILVAPRFYGDERRAGKPHANRWPRRSYSART